MWQVLDQEAGLHQRWDVSEWGEFYADLHISVTRWTILKDSSKRMPMLPALSEASTLSSQTWICEQGGRARRVKRWFHKKVSFVLFNLSLFRSIQVSISRTQASNLHLLNSISRHLVCYAKAACHPHKSENLVHAYCRYHLVASGVQWV